MKTMFKRIILLFVAVIMFTSSITFTVPVYAKSESGLTMARQKVIAEMKKMAVAQWTAGQTFKTYYYYSHTGSGSSMITWSKGKTYYGIPYSQNPNVKNKINNSIYANYKVFEGSLGKNRTLSKDLGRNDCSSSVVMAIKKVDPNIKFTFSRSMNPGTNTLVKVGKYKMYSGKLNTCKQNGRDVMYDSYSKLKPGDMLIRDGHAMMAIKADPEKKQVTVIHHAQAYKHYYPEKDITVDAKNGIAFNTLWGVNEVISYSYLWSNGFIPLANEKLVEDDKKSHDVTMSEKVKGLQIAETEDKAVTLSWDEDKKATGYIIYQFKDRAYDEIGRTKKTTYTVSELVSAKDYRFAVKSYVRYEEKTNAVIDYAFIDATTQPRKAVITSVMLNKNGTSAVITWNAVSRAEKYYIYQGTEKEGKYKYLGSSKETSYKVEELDKDKTYYFRVCAMIKRGDTKIKGELSTPKRAIK